MDHASPASLAADGSGTEERSHADVTGVVEKLPVRPAEDKGSPENLSSEKKMYLGQEATQTEAASETHAEPAESIGATKKSGVGPCTDVSLQPTAQNPEVASERDPLPASTTTSRMSGVTPPMSLNEPTEQDLLMTKQMIAELDAEFPRETPGGMAHRESVLEELDEVVRNWITEMGVKEGLSEEDARNFAFKIITLGSYRLGVVQPTSDIDTLCVGPPYVSREAFFEGFVERLKECESVTDCVPIPDAFTPIIKLKMRDVSIDLLFAKLVEQDSLVPRTDQEQEEMLKEDKILRHMDEKSVRSLNGHRVADHLLELVPNHDAFRQTLRFVKYWARRRGIYSNVLGFFGGITWALLVARVCQLYPNFCASQLVNRFFRVYHMWDCPRPVMLCDLKDPQSVPGMAGAKVWNPKTNPADRLHVMPVITPAFPAMNSTHNVTETTKRILLDEFRRGYEVLRGPENASFQPSLLPAVARSVEEQTCIIRELHEPFPYFTRFFHFLWLEVLAKTQEVFLKWNGWVESRLRILMKQLESPRESTRGMIIHPNPEQYDLRLFGCEGDLLMSTGGDDGDWPFGSGMFICLAFIKGRGAFAGQSIDLRPACMPFLEVVMQWAEMDQFKGKFLLRLKRIKASSLPKYALEAEAEKKRLRKERRADLNGLAGVWSRTTSHERARGPTVSMTAAVRK
eukprot:TRINITY_DN6632_c0_g2_i1.p1 TRINITY_DN6632_c0_g2~~TRINITY_DN6632_c0_g2_i1.p1  ORF type:complete len:685 (-),score=116.27 TRINITY_DN6632_c0_g2_i1:27-2081(-)